MATYKVIQDIEAEDKLLGPFGLRQFIYLIIVAVSLFIGFKLSAVSPLLILPLLPHTIFFAALALPIGGEQPTETWLLAKIRFMIKPRVRIWDQTGVTNLVTITAPKRVEKVLTKNLSETEVKSRLKALANTIDSRGWAVKNVNVNLFSQPTFAATGAASDRLVDAGTVAQTIQTPGVNASDDMLDEHNNPTAQNLDRMITQASKAHISRVKNSLKRQDQNNQAKISIKRKDPTTIPIVNDSNLHPFRGITYDNKESDANDAPAAAPGAPSKDAYDEVQLPEPEPLPKSAPIPAAEASTNDGPEPDYWFMDETPAPVKEGQATFEKSVVRPEPEAVKTKKEPKPAWPPQPTGNLTEEQLLEKIREEKKKQPHSYGNLRVIKPIEEQKKEAEEAAKRAAKEAEELAETRMKNELIDNGPFEASPLAAPLPSNDNSMFKATYASPLDNPINSGIPADDSSVTQSIDPDIIELANNDDLYVDTIARQAKKNKEKELPKDGEVVIKLH